MTRPLYILRSNNKIWTFNWPEILQFKDLLYFLAWRDIKVRYKQTFIGVLWALFQPLATMAIFSFLFGRLVHIPSDGVPYPIFVYTGLVFWTFFSAALTTSSASFIDNEKILTKVYFPRILLPLSSLVVSSVDFLISLIILGAIMLFYGITPSLVGICMLPLLMSLTALVAAGIGLFLASLNVKYRDVRFVLPFLIQLMMFVTPVIYSLRIVPKKFEWLFYLNPMAGIIDTARSALLGIGHVSLTTVGIASLGTAIYMTLGFAYFKTVERFFSDVI